MDDRHLGCIEKSFKKQLCSGPSPNTSNTTLYSSAKFSKISSATCFTQGRRDEERA